MRSSDAKIARVARCWRCLWLKQVHGWNQPKSGGYAPLVKPSADAQAMSFEGARAVGWRASWAMSLIRASDNWVVSLIFLDGLFRPAGRIRACM